MSRLYGRFDNTLQLQHDDTSFLNKVEIMAKKKSAYAKAGVDIDIMMNALQRSKAHVQSTFTEGVASDVGSFGGLFQAPGKNQFLVSSADGVGTKLKVAVMANRHNTVGQDLVNHCTNDILVQGAKPLFFMDYIGAAALQPDVFEQLVKGLSKACKENGCALLGGETAEMPGLYPKGEYDLVGTIVGAVDKKSVITGESIRKGDVLIGLRSTGLQTNGYSLARDILFKKAKLKIDDAFPGMKKSVADVLLSIHKSYLNSVSAVMEKVNIHGMAHITGGGLVDNVPRMMPDGLTAVIDRSTWKPSTVFQVLQDIGGIDREEMFRVFNMGIGMVLAVRENNVVEAVEILKANKEKPVIIGLVEKGDKAVHLCD